MMSRLGRVAPRPAEEPKKPAGKRIAAAQMPWRASTLAAPCRWAASARTCAIKREDHEHAGVGVSCAGECLLEPGRGLVAAHDPQHGQAAELDGEDGEQQDPGGGAGVAGQGQGGRHLGLSSSVAVVACVWVLVLAVRADRPAAAIGIPASSRGLGAPARPLGHGRLIARAANVRGRKPERCHRPAPMTAGGGPARQQPHVGAACSRRKAADDPACCMRRWRGHRQFEQTQRAHRPVPWTFCGCAGGRLRLAVPAAYCAGWKPRLLPPVPLSATRTRPAAAQIASVAHRPPDQAPPK